MDSSRLMNVVYDDPFDGNYIKYDGGADLWSNGNEIMEMELTESLHGILPMATTENFVKDDAAAGAANNNKNSFMYEDYAGHGLSSGGSIEIVTVDPNAEVFDSDSDDNAANDSNDEDDNDIIEFDRQSQCSNLTFRTRTDSSSIGDYESHTSDYEDSDDGSDDIDEEEYVQDLKATDNNVSFKTPLLSAALLEADDLNENTSSLKKMRTFSTNTICSDVDGLGLNIDANNFDLAEFITKDDFTLSLATEIATSIASPSPKKTISVNAVKNFVSQIPSKSADIDSDSDTIVDVETVGIDDEDDVNMLRKASDLLKPEVEVPVQEDLTYVDNVVADPSWSPCTTTRKADNSKVEQKSTCQKNSINHNINLMPNKKQCEILKGKNKAKLVSNATKTAKSKQTKALTNGTDCSLSIASKKTGVGMGGKNLALLKHRQVSISEHSSEDNTSPHKKNVITASHNHSSHTNPVAAQQSTVVAQTVKRKLNLEEYKKRRGDTITNDTQCKKTAATISNCNGATISPKSFIPIPVCSKSNNAMNTPVKHSEAVTSIVKSLKEQQHRPAVDPITEARNKVLRMQELKRAQQMRIIDSTISAKVPKVTKLLPLKEIIKDTPYQVDDGANEVALKSLKCHPDYEEIIIVSVSCNTDISLPPTVMEDAHLINPATRSLLKSSALLSTISSSFQKAKANENVKISNNSLIASIQDVVVKKTLPIAVKDNDGDSTIVRAKNNGEHGEDKIIMHLRKDRIRMPTCTISTQTDMQAEFPTLPLPKIGLQQKSRGRKRRKQRNYRSNRDVASSGSSSSEDSSDEQSDHSNSSSFSRSRDNSSSSAEGARTYDSAIGTGGYSSRSSHKHRSSVSPSPSDGIDRVSRGRRQRRTSFKQRSSRKRSRSPYTSSSYTSDSERSRSPLYNRRSRSRSGSRRARRLSYRQNNSNNFLDRNVSQPAVEERRIVYVGRIEQETTKDMLRRKFLPYGTIKQISIHYKETGMKYGFVTFERSEDAFAAIDNSTRDTQINMYDVSFGGRRAFCRASYADLDNAGINTYQSFVFPKHTQQPKEDDSFEALLQKMKAKLNASKKPTDTSSTAGECSTTGAANASVASNGKM